MDNRAKQVALSSILGDGSVKVADNCVNAKLVTSTLYKEYADFKLQYLYKYRPRLEILTNKGYTSGKTLIHRIVTGVDEDFTKLSAYSLQEVLEGLDYLGIALWFLDDGSYHKSYHFYNLCTHAFSEKENRTISNYLNSKLGILSTVSVERKRDGRVFHYLRIPKLQGAHIISRIIRENVDLKCFQHKLMELGMEEELFEDWIQASMATPAGASYLDIKKKVVTIRKRRNAYKRYNKFG